MSSGTAQAESVHTVLAVTVVLAAVTIAGSWLWLNFFPFDEGPHHGKKPRSFGGRHWGWLQFVIPALALGIWWVAAFLGVHGHHVACVRIAVWVPAIPVVIAPILGRLGIKPGDLPPIPDTPRSGPHP